MEVARHRAGSAAGRPARRLFREMDILELNVLWMPLAYNRPGMITGRSWRFWVFLMGLAVTVALFLFAWAYPKFPGDEPVLLGVQSQQTEWLDGMVWVLDDMGELPVVLALAGVLMLALFTRGRPADAVMVGMSLFFMGAGQALKPVVGRVRPEHMLAGAEYSGFAFPSGHSVYAFLLGGLLIYFAAGLIRKPVARVIVQAAIALWVVAMGASRVYLGVHWPSDVIGGFMFGAMALMVIITLRNTLTSR